MRLEWLILRRSAEDEVSPGPTTIHASPLDVVPQSSGLQYLHHVWVLVHLFDQILEPSDA